MKKVRSPLQSKYVPYVKIETPEDAKPFLPAGPNDSLTAQRVHDFAKAARQRPELKLAVLTTLRAHSINGAETPLAGIAALFAALAVYAGIATQTVSGWLWLFWILWGAFTVGGALQIVRVSFAAHARRLVASTWLAAYQDELSEPYFRTRFRLGHRRDLTRIERGSSE